MEKAAATHWRYCVKRPEVGFDHHGPWGTWQSAVASWWFDDAQKPGQPAYMQRSVAGKVETVEIDRATMDSARQRQHLWTDAELTERVAQSKAATKAPRAALAA